MARKEIVRGCVSILTGLTIWELLARLLLDNELLIPPPNPSATHMIAEAISLSDRGSFQLSPRHDPPEFQVSLERPRNMEMRADPRFLELENILWKQIEAEVNAAGGFARI